MAFMNVKGTQAERMGLKWRLDAARRGCGLLTGKLDGMTRRFFPLSRENASLRTEVEEKLKVALAEFLLADCAMDPLMNREALMYPSRSAEIIARKAQVLSVEVPKIEIDEDGLKAQTPSYGFAQTSPLLDHGIALLAEVLPDMIRLAEIEKTCSLLSDEIAKTRRRAGALRFAAIPDMEGTIRYIRRKQKEDEGYSQSRLVKNRGRKGIFHG